MVVVAAGVIKAAVADMAVVVTTASPTMAVNQAAVDHKAVVETIKHRNARISIWAIASTEISAPTPMEIRNLERQQSVEPALSPIGFPLQAHRPEASLPRCLRHLSQ